MVAKLHSLEEILAETMTLASAFGNVINCQKVKKPLPLNTLADSIQVNS
jgi:hypothetical protein